MITGTLASALMRAIRLLPPRGMITSTNSGIAIRRPTAARSVVATSCTASGGRPASSSASCTTCASARLLWIASEPPRRIAALPLLMASDAASMVTLGRLSKTMPKTPSGTRMRPTLMPLGRRCTPLISPTGSGIAASCSQPSATVSMICGVSLSRSTSGAARPPACAADNVLGVGRLQGGGAGAQAPRERQQRSVPGCRRRRRHRARRRARGRADLGHVCSDVARIHAAIVAQPSQVSSASQPAKVATKARVENTIAAVASPCNVP